MVICLELETVVSTLENLIFYGDSESAKIVLDKYAQQVKLISNWFAKMDQVNQFNFTILVSSERCNMGSNMFEQFSDVNFESSRF